MAAMQHAMVVDNQCIARSKLDFMSRICGTFDGGRERGKVGSQLLTLYQPRGVEQLRPARDPKTVLSTGLNGVQ